MGDFRSDFERKVEELLGTIKDRNKVIYSSISYTYGGGGKRVRPTLCFLCYRALARGNERPKEYQDVLLSSVCVELLHTASLMLDDVIDNSDFRRGRPSANAVFGNKVAVISASYLIGLVSKVIVDMGNEELTKKFVETSNLMAEGEALEFDLMIHTASDLSRSIIQEIYFEVIRKKTASLFSLSSSIPAIICDRRYIDYFSSLGTLIGMAFQVRDDMLDFSARDKIGKTSLKDLKEGKITLPIILSDNYERIIDIMRTLDLDHGGDIPQEVLENVRDLVVRGGGLERSREYLSNLGAEIYSFIDGGSFDSSKMEMVEFVRFLIERDF